MSRLARNNRDWYQLLDLCSVTDTLIGDGDGVYHPALPDDRLILGLRGTMSEAELHVMQARLRGGSDNKAARGELRLLVPIGLVWKRGAKKPQLDPDEAVTGALRTVFRAFSEKGSITPLEPLNEPAATIIITKASTPMPNAIFKFFELDEDIRGDFVLNI